MNIRTIIAATCAALAFSMAGPIYAHDSEAQTVTKNFEAAIPNIPGKSLIAVEVEDAHLSGRRELVRTAGRYPFDQPQREQDRAGKAARCLRPRHQ